jgi:ABC-type phosphate transport system substrate-binding protein
MRARAGAVTILALLGGAAAVEGGDVAIIVHRSHPQSTITMGELTRIFRLDQQYWKTGEKVDLVLQMSGSTKEVIVLERLYRMKEGDLKPFWLGKIYRGELTAPPRAFASDASVKQYVAASPRAVGYIDSALLDATVKALRVDGKLPGEPGYPLARAGN